MPNTMLVVFGASRFGSRKFAEVTAVTPGTPARSHPAV